MQVGTMSGTFKRETLEETLDASLAQDIFHLQFNWGSAHPSGPLPEVIDEIANYAGAEFRKRNMVVSAVAGNANMVDIEPKKRQKAIDKLLMIIPACAKIGTTVIATCTGSRDPESMWRNHPDNQSDTTWKTLRNTLEKILPAAEAAGIDIAFEPEYNNVCQNARLSRKLIDEMASPRLKVVMDAANIFGKDDLSRMTEVLDEAFDLLGDYIAIAHGKDLDHGGDAGHLPAGTGKLDYAHYVKLLCGLSFDVPVILHGLTEEQLPESAAMLRHHSAKYQ
ncbi:MAG: sugar phosphate isomerase/epimerase [Gammaproteobacteria bacterium TMED1]|nr:MAG: sugar phosphate isomerase/epimerase [Gammaproteobacteria bacterium TMED1]|tara:strand:- start:405 stop:1241 length:837 start_codon:yes stop_codon:yes gene_type:complete